MQKNIQFFGYGHYNKYVFLISYLGSIYCVTDIPKYVSSENFYELSILEMNLSWIVICDIKNILIYLNLIPNNYFFL
jgi:predicted metalloprotease with PDZ domain